MVKRVPALLEQHILPFNWDVRKVWALEAPVRTLPTAELIHLLQLPLWSSVPDQGLLFDVCPIDVIRNPAASEYQAGRIRAAWLEYPIDVLLMHEKRWILDGVHRIAKHFSLGHTSLPVRFHGESVVPGIRLG